MLRYQTTLPQIEYDEKGVGRSFRACNEGVQLGEIIDEHMDTRARALKDPPTAARDDLAYGNLLSYLVLSARPGPWRAQGDDGDTA